MQGSLVLHAKKPSFYEAGVSEIYNQLTISAITKPPNFAIFCSKVEFLRSVGTLSD